jgi:ParB-like chromosome segregation protein Spo0J
MSNKHNTVARKELPFYAPEDLVLIGLDTPHKSKAEHPLFDERVFAPVPEEHVNNAITYGILQNVICRRNGNVIEVVAGRQRVKRARLANERLRAAGSAALIKVPVQLRKDDEKTMIGVMIGENEVRSNDRVLRKAENAAQMESYGASRAEIATAFGVTQAAICGWLKLHGLHEIVKQAIRDGKISAKAASRLADLKVQDQPTALGELLADPSARTDAEIDGESDGGEGAGEGTGESKPKRVSTKDVDAKINGGKDALAAPSMREIKKLVQLISDGEEEQPIAAEFLMFLRVLAGELPVTKIAGLKSALAQVRGLKGGE